MADSGMNRGGVSEPIRWGLWVLGVVGLLFVPLWILVMMSPGDVATDTQDFVNYWTAEGILVGLLYLFGLALMILGVVALYGLIVNDQNRTLALSALVLCVVALALLLAIIGTLVLGAEMVASTYDEGNTGVVPALERFEGGEFTNTVNVLLITATALALLGGLAFAVGIWRSAALPKWSAVAFAAGIVLFATSTPVIAQVGGLLLGIAGIWLARAVTPRMTTAASAHVQAAP